MKRKLFSAMLSIFALLLLMGAAAVPEQPAALLAEEESAETSALETEAKPSPLISVGGAPKNGEAVNPAEPDQTTEPEDPAGPGVPEDP